MLIVIGDRSRAVAQSNVNLCLTCRHYSAVAYSLNDSEERNCYRNYENPVRLRGPVSRCTDYDNKTAPSEHEMRKIAWSIEPSTRKVGFDTCVEIKPPKRKDDD